MAPKRDEPPPSRAAPSEEEESSSESIATEEEEEEEEQEDPEEEEEESESESESDPEKTQPQIQEQPKKQPLSQPKHTPPPPSVQEPSSESGSESGSGSESESEPESPPKPNLVVSPNLKKPKPQQLTPSKTPSLKRPSESEDSRKPDGKKKKSSHEGHGSEDTAIPSSEKKPVFQRLWSDEDEIALLKGMVDFAEKKGVDPSTRTSEFYEFVKKNIKMEASQAQLANKIRNFKKRFKNNQGKGKDGQDKVSKNPHDQRAFELMKKLWSAGKGIVPEDGTKMNGTKETKKSKVVVPKEDIMVSPKKDKDVVEKSSNSLLKKVGPAMEDSMCVIEMSRLFPQSVDKLFLKGLELIGEKERAELEEGWMKLRLAEMNIADERAVLFHKQSRLIIDALNHETS